MSIQMKATKQYLTVLLFIVLFHLVQCLVSLSVTIQMKATEQYLTVLRLLYYSMWFSVRNPQV